MQKKLFKVRRLRLGDCDDLIRNYYSYYDELGENPYFGLLMYRKKPGWKSERGWFKSLYSGVKKGSTIAAVAESGGKAIGLCEITIKRPGSEMDHGCELGIAIRKEYRSMGIGRALMAEIISKAKRRHTEIIKLSVVTKNERAKALYRKMGFKKYGELKGAIKRNGRYLDEDLMVLRLKK